MPLAPPQPQFPENPETSAAVELPLIAACGLSPAEHGLVDFWLSPFADRMRRWPRGEFQPGRLSRGLHYFPEADVSFCGELLQCYRPLLVLLGSQAQRRPETRDELFAAGVAACWAVPAPDAAGFAFPLFPPRRKRAPVYLIEDNPIYRSLLRQLLYFAGYDVRADQHSLAALEELVAIESEGPHSTGNADDATGSGLADEPGTRENPALAPAMIIASLDTERLDIPAFFHRLDVYIQRYVNRHRPGRGPRILLTKDFQRPGLDVRTIEQSLRAHAARIFHPREALLVLLEALFLRDAGTDGRASAPSTGARSAQPETFRTLDELLYRPQIRLRDAAPALDRDDSLARRSIQPFVWLYDLLSEDPGRGAILRL